MPIPRRIVLNFSRSSTLCGGVPAARRRQCVCGFSGSQCPQLEPFGRYQVQDPPTLRQLPLEVQPSENLFVDGKVTVERTIMTTGDPWLPHSAGHVYAEGTKHLLHSNSGPACALTGKEDRLKGYGGTLLLVDGGRARSLSAREVARIQGLNDHHDKLRDPRRTRSLVAS